MAMGIIGDRYIGSLFRVDEPVPIIGDRYIGSLFRVDDPVPMILKLILIKNVKFRGMTFLLFRLAYNSGFLCKFAAVKKNL